VIYKLLDELVGSKWFSKLDLFIGWLLQDMSGTGGRVQYTFQTYNEHFEFLVMAFGLTGASATFQFSINVALALVFVLVCTSIFR
jgi:hypothetical protein